MKAEWLKNPWGGWELVLGEYGEDTLVKIYEKGGKYEVIHILCGRLENSFYPTLTTAQAAAEQAVLQHLHEEIAALIWMVAQKESIP